MGNMRSRRMDVSSYFECRGNRSREIGGWIREQCSLGSCLGSFGCHQEESWVKRSEKYRFS